jgi:quercetin dioxygenase-like cupin family protein
VGPESKGEREQLAGGSGEITAKMEKVKITTRENAPGVPFNLDGRILYTSKETEIVHLELKPGEKVESHAQPFDVLFYAIEGEAFLLAGGKEFRIIAGSLAEVKTGLQRGWHNDSGAAFRVLVIKKMT